MTGIFPNFSKSGTPFEGGMNEAFGQMQSLTQEVSTSQIPSITGGLHTGRVYPVDGTYFIYNVAAKRFMNLGGRNMTEGAPIIGWEFTYVQAKSATNVPTLTPPDNQKWILSRVPKSRNEGIHLFTIQCASSKGAKLPSDAGGYIRIKSKELVYSDSPEVWQLTPVDTNEKTYRIRPIVQDDNMDLCDAGKEPRGLPDRQLVLLDANQSDGGPVKSKFNWIFIPAEPAGEIDSFLKKQDIKPEID